MLTVSIFINGNPIYTRTVVNVTKGGKARTHVYEIDTGERITHDPKDGAIPLAIKLLESIHEVK